LSEIFIHPIQLHQVNPFEERWGAVLSHQLVRSETVQYTNYTSPESPDSTNFEPNVWPLESPWRKQDEHLLRTSSCLKYTVFKVITELNVSLVEKGACSVVPKDPS
jgi:hypothetical protein